MVFRLKQFVGDQRERGSLPTEDSALDYLLDKFKEYVRKPQVRMCVFVTVYWCLLFSQPDRRQRQADRTGQDAYVIGSLWSTAAVRTIYEYYIVYSTALLLVLLH